MEIHSCNQCAAIQDLHLKHWPQSGFNRNGRAFVEGPSYNMLKDVAEFKRGKTP